MLVTLYRNHHHRLNEAKQMNKSINGNLREQVKQLCYLSSIIADDCTCHTSIIRRIAMGKNAFPKIKVLLRGE